MSRDGGSEDHDLDRVTVEAALAGVTAAFSGVVRVDVGEETVFELATGLADRGHGIPVERDTRFAIASGTKGVTALTVLALVERGELGLDTPARRLLGRDLPLIDDAVTVEHLLAHRSGIGDYLDEEQLGSIDEYVMDVPVHRLDSIEAYRTVLDGVPMRFPPGDRFAYNNSGYVVLALLAERATTTPFAALADQLVCRPAGLTDTGFVRTDEAGELAVGYLAADGLRTNVLHLPVLGGGDGGLSTTVGDVHRLWRAWMAGRIVSPATVATMVRPRSTGPGGRRYGLGCWLDPVDDAIALEGYDAGISFLTRHRPSTATTWTVISNWSDGAWPVARALAELTAGH